MFFYRRVAGQAHDLRNALDAIGRKQPHVDSRTQFHPLELEVNRSSIDGEGVDALTICRKIAGSVALRLVAEVCDIELRIAIENLLQLLRELRAILQSFFG